MSTEAPGYKSLMRATDPQDETQEDVAGATPSGIEKEGQAVIRVVANCDAYDAVMAAAFGGIRIVFPSDRWGMDQSMRLHPIFIFGFCIVLFMVQMSCLSCLIMDMELDTTADDESLEVRSSWQAASDDPRENMKNVVKLTMVCVLQLVYLKEILGALRPLCLLMNPISWFELKRPSLDKKGFAFDARICAPICIAAQMMQFSIAYYVLSVSMSVIVVATNVKDVIFNGLVVTFLADLDEFAWSAMAAVFHLDERAFADFVFETKDADADHEKWDDAANEVFEFREKARKAKIPWKLWFYRGKGGKAVVTESLVIFFGLALMYIRQLLMLVQSVDTGILPVARDVCSLYRGYKQPFEYFKDYIILRVVDFFTLINYATMLEATVTHEKFQEACFSEEYMKGPFDDIAHYYQAFGWRLWGATAAIVVIFAGPQILFSNYIKILRFLEYTTEQIELKRGASVVLAGK